MSSQNSDLLCSISSNGDTVALCTPDGVIKFYDTLTSNLKLEYSSSTHLQASCTCLSWPKYKRAELHAPVVPAAAKQKKAKTNAQQQTITTESSNSTIGSELNDLNLISIGTSEGAILLFSLTKADLHTQLVSYFFLLFWQKIKWKFNPMFSFWSAFKVRRRPLG